MSKSAPGKPVLEIKKAFRTYGSGETALEILKGIDFVLNEGEMVALIAPSGAGKSTLLHTAGLLERPDSGEVVLHGTSYKKRSDRDRTQARRDEIGFVYQFHHLLPEFTALENTVIPQLIAGKSQKEAERYGLELLDYLDIADRADHRPAELSGGEQQRTAIARAVANRPSVLLADEPTGNLDPETSNKVFATLMHLVRESNLAAIIATHNHQIAAKADRIVTLKDGHISVVKRNAKGLPVL